MKRVKEAIADYERVLELEPKNKQAKLELEKLRKVKEDKEEPILMKKKGDQFGHNIRVSSKTFLNLLIGNLVLSSSSSSS